MKLKPFENFDIKFNNQKKEVDTIKLFPNSDKRILIISGSVGSGKTHLAKELKRLYYIKYPEPYNIRRRDPAFVKADLLYYIFMQANFPNMEVRSNLTYELLDLIMSVCLVIDDLGSEIEDKKGYFKLGLKELLDDCKGNVIITTNLNWERLNEIYGEKIYSRMCQSMEWVEVTGKDYRKKQ